MKQLQLLFVLLATAAFAQTPAAFPGSYLVQNDTSTGPTFQKLAKLSAGKAILSGTADTSSIGICVQNCTTSGSAVIAFSGIVGCIVDGTTTIDHWVVLSTTVAGDCHDSGATTYPTTGVVVGQVVQVSTGAASISQINLNKDMIGASSGGSGGASTSQGTYAALPGTCTTGNLYFFTNSLYSHARCSATDIWSKFYRGLLVTPLSEVGACTWVNQNSSTVSDTNGPRTIVLSTADTGLGYSLCATAVPAGSFTRTIPFRWANLTGSSSAIGVGIRQGSGANAGRFYMANFAMSTGSYSNGFFDVRHMSDPATFVAQDFVMVPPNFFNNWTSTGEAVIQIQWDGTNLTFRLSNDGYAFIDLFTTSSLYIDITATPQIIVGGIGPSLATGGTLPSVLTVVIDYLGIQ